MSIDKLSQEYKVKLLEDKINELTLENEKLKEKSSGLISILSIDEELICRGQMSRLKKTSDERELTLEETRKLEIFYKILSSLLNQNKGETNKPEKKVDSAQLLSLVEAINDK